MVSWDKQKVNISLESSHGVTLPSHFISASWGSGKSSKGVPLWLLEPDASPAGSLPSVGERGAAPLVGGGAPGGGSPGGGGGGEARQPHLALGRSRPGVAWAPGASGEETRTASTNTNTQARPSSSEPSLPSEPQLHSGSRA